MAIVTLSSKGQLVIPWAIRKALGIEPNTRVRITISEDKKRLLFEPLPKDPIETLTGIFKDHPESIAEELLNERKLDLGKEGA